jgi:peptidyl-prolyl cis-trans isomerase D
MVLQSIRERLTGILAIFILGILVIPFAFVGINSYFQGGAENLVARVNDRDITSSDFTQSFSTYRQRMQSIMGASFDPTQFDSLLARREHLDSMIDEEVLSQAARGIELDIDDERLGEQIRSIPAFHLDGEFNLDVYLSRLTSQGLSVKQFERQMRAQFIMGQLPNSVLRSSIATATELRDYVSLQDQKRTFKTILIPPASNETAAQPDDAAIQAWYDENQASFQSEEMVEIEYVELSVLDIPSGTEPDEEFLKNRFEAQKGRFLSPEQRQISHILVEVAASADDAVKETARQEAQDAADRARAGEDFADLARGLSDDVGSAEFGGDLGWMEPGVMSETFEDAMYELTLENPVSDPVQTGLGCHVIQLRDIQPAAGMSYEEARATLVQEHREEESEREFLDQADRLVDMIYEDPTTLDAAALDLGLDVKRTGPFTRAGGEGVAANPEVISAAFSELVLLQGSVSDPIELELNHIVMIRVNEHFPVATLAMDDVRDRIVTQIQSERALEAARREAEALLASAQEEGADLAAIAEQGAYELIETEAAVRRNFVPDRTVVEEVFRLDAPAPGERLARVVNADSGYALVVLESVTAGSLEQGATLNEQQYRRQIANAAASIEFTGLMRQLREAADIQIYEDRLR